MGNKILYIEFCRINNLLVMYNNVYIYKLWLIKVMNLVKYDFF